MQMREDNFQQEVPWKRILSMVHRNLERDKWLLEWWNSRAGNADPTKENSYRTVQNNLAAYQALRRFLGFSEPVKLEREIEELLCQIEMLPKKEEA